MPRLLKKELLLLLRSWHESCNGLLFFVMVAALFPLTLNFSQQQLSSLAPGVIWISALLATLLNLPQLFRDDFSDGSLVQAVLGPQPLALVVLAKITAHWLVFSVPLILVAPLLALLFQLSNHVLWVLLLTLLIGTPILQFLGAFAAALTAGLRQASILLVLLLMPFFVPVLIFACGAVNAAMQQMAFTVPLCLLLALLLVAASVLPVVAAAALRISVNY